MYTDSPAACYILKEAQEKCYIDEVIHNILKPSEKLNAEIRWIPAHINIAGNEKADQLAKKGSLSEKIIENKLRISDTTINIENTMRKETEDWYTAECREKGKKLEEFHKEFQFKPWYDEIPLSANEIKTTNKLLVDHDFSRYWLAKMKIEENGDCPTCHTPETGRHKIFYCTKYKIQRDSNPLISWNNFICNWKEKTGTTIKEIIRFMKENNIEI